MLKNLTERFWRSCKRLRFFKPKDIFDNSVRYAAAPSNIFRHQRTTPFFRSVLVCICLTFNTTTTMTNETEKQYFGKVKCSFTARKTKDYMSAIYANVNVPSESRRLSVSLHVKVKPWHFLKSKQRCLVSNSIKGVDNYNNRVANDAMKSFLARVESINAMIEDADDPFGISVHDLLLPKRKARELSLCDIFYHTIDQQLKRGVISGKAHARKVSVVKSFTRYFKGRYDEINTSVYNGYGDWLVEQGKNISTINAYLSAVKSMVGDVNKTEAYPLVNTQNWAPMFDKRSKEEKRSSNIMFSDDDYGKIAALELEGSLEMVRDFFVFSCNVGQRPADCARILQGEYKMLDYDGKKFIEIIPSKTKKTGNTATIPVNPTITALLYKFTVRPDYAAFVRESNFDKYATKKLKDIFKAAGVGRSVTITEQNGNDKTSKTVMSDERAHLYLARHYFITRMVRNGLRPDQISKMTGHSTTKMIEMVYTHLNSEDRCAIISDAFSKAAVGE